MKKNNKRSSKVNKDNFYEKLKNSFAERFPIQSEESDGIEFRIKSVVQEAADVNSAISLSYESELGVTKICAAHNEITEEEWFAILHILSTLGQFQYCETYKNPEELEIGCMAYLREKDLSLFRKMLDEIFSINHAISVFLTGRRDLEEHLDWRRPNMCED